MNSIDRRQKRTHEALLAAFRDLVLEGGYARLTVGDIIARANIGRSTFYEHFDGKAGLLRESLVPFVTHLAEALDPAAGPATMTSVLEHLWEHRRIARALLAGAAGEIAHEQLVEHLISRVSRPANDVSTIVPLSLAASQVAAAQLALIQCWLTGDTRCEAPTIAVALVRTSAAVMRALTR